MKYFWLFWLLVSVTQLSVAGLKVRVLDQQGQALEHAVVAVSGMQEAVVTEKQHPSNRENGVMDQVDKQFFPHVLVIKTGQFVVFPNSDQVRHHVYSFSKPNDFEIRLYSGDQADPVQFMNPGIVVLGCNIHDQMQAFLYVTDPREVAAVSDKSGLVELDLPYVASEPVEVSIWHSRLSSERTLKVKQALTEQDEQGTWLVRVNVQPEPKKINRKFKFRYD